MTGGMSGARTPTGKMDQINQPIFISMTMTKFDKWLDRFHFWIKSLELSKMYVTFCDILARLLYKLFKIKLSTGPFFFINVSF